MPARAITPVPFPRVHLRGGLPCWHEGRPLPTDLYAYTDATPAAWPLLLNESPLQPEQENGYLKITRLWQPGDTLRLTLAMPVRRVTGHPAVAATAGQVALKRGPLVYAFEDTEHAGSIATLTLSDTTSCHPVHRPDFLDGATVLEITDSSASATAPAVAIPYALWANCGPGPMRVWLPRCGAVST